MTRTWLPVVLLAFVALTGWLMFRLDEDERPVRRSGPREADYYMERFTRTSMDAAGRIKDRLRAELMVHYAYDGSTELVSPKLDIYNESGEPWQVTAERGWVAEDNEVILLYGEVEVWRNDSAGRREMELITRDLKLLRTDRYAESDHATTVRDRHTVSRGIGMRADFHISRIDLLKDVRTRHEVTP